MRGRRGLVIGSIAFVLAVLWSTPAFADPIKPNGGFAILRGNLAPEGCVVKLAGHERLHHRGPARVFEGEEATPKPIALEIDQHPQLAPNGTSSMHVDGWATDAYAGPGHKWLMAPKGTGFLYINKAATSRIQPIEWEDGRRFVL